MKDNKRNKQIKIYLTDEEYNSYLYLKKNTGLNMNQFFRKELLNKYKEEKENEKENNRSC